MLAGRDAHRGCTHPPSRIARNPSVSPRVSNASPGGQHADFTHLQGGRWRRQGAPRGRDTIGDNITELQRVKFVMKDGNAIRNDLGQGALDGRPEFFDLAEKVLAQSGVRGFWVRHGMYMT